MQLSSWILLRALRREKSLHRRIHQSRPYFYNARMCGTRIDSVAIFLVACGGFYLLGARKPFTPFLAQACLSQTYP